MRLCLLGWLLLAWQDSAPTQVIDEVTTASATISADRLREHAKYLASDELEGRLAGTPGNQKAAEYIARHLKEFGYEPLGDKDESRGYFQKFSPKEDVVTQNVVALLRGADETLRNECVVIGAHYDHVGTADQKYMGRARLGKATETDKIWNGADDNASGTVTLLEIARAFSALKGKTKRSIIFVWFSCEEWGLLGSRHFVKNPPEEFPRAGMTAMINLDMVGRNASRPCGVYGLGTEKGEMFESLVKQATELSKLDARLIGSASIGGGDSDHTSFRKENIPVMFFFTGGHADYHQPGDHPDKLEYNNMVKVGRTALIILHQLSVSPERPKFDPEANKASSAGTPKLKHKLGVMPDYNDLDDAAYDQLGLGKEEGGLKVTSVTKDSVGDKAGIKDGDLIISIAGEKLPRKEPIVRYMEILNAKVEPGKPVEIVVIRKGEKVKLSAVWEK